MTTYKDCYICLESNIEEDMIYIDDLSFCSHVASQYKAILLKLYPNG